MQFIRQYKPKIIGVLLIALILLAGWWGWDYYQGLNVDYNRPNFTAINQPTN